MSGYFHWYINRYLIRCWSTAALKKRYFHCEILYARCKLFEQFKCRRTNSLHIQQLSVSTYRFSNSRNQQISSPLVGPFNVEELYISIVTRWWQNVTGVIQFGDFNSSRGILPHIALARPTLWIIKHMPLSLIESCLISLAIIQVAACGSYFRSVNTYTWSIQGFVAHALRLVFKLEIHPDEKLISFET